MENEPLYHMWLNLKSLVHLHSVAFLFFFCFLQNKVITDLYQYFVAVVNKTIIPLALVGYEMTIANSGIYIFIFNVRSWNNC